MAKYWLYSGYYYTWSTKRLFIYSIGGDPTSNETEELFDSVYTNFVEEVDAVDNGIESRDGLPRLAMLHEFAWIGYLIWQTIN